MIAILLTYAFVAIILWFVTATIRHVLSLKKFSHIPVIAQQLFPPLPLPSWFPHIPFLTSIRYSNRYAIYVEKSRGKPLTRVSYGTKSNLLINDPTLIKEVWVKKFKNYEKPKEYEMFDVFGSSILTSNGDVWLSHRSLSSKAFVASNYELVAQVANESMTLLMNKWKSTSPTPTIQVNACDEFNEVTFDILGKAGFGSDFEVYHGGQNSIGKAMNNSISYDIVLRGVVLLMSPQWLRKLLINYEPPNLKRVHQFIDELIEKRQREQDPRNRDLLSLLVRAKQEEAEEEGTTPQGNSLSIQEIRANIFIFLLAGLNVSFFSCFFDF